MADAAGNDVVKFHKDDTPSATVLSTTGQPVPTSLAWGPGGDLYIGTLNFEAGPAARDCVPPERPHRRAVGVRDWSHGHHPLAFGDHGRLYVTEWTTGFTANGPSLRW